MKIEIDEKEAKFLLVKLAVATDEGRKRMSHAASHGDHYEDTEAVMGHMIIERILSALKFQT